MQGDWRKVNGSAPCPICGKPDWCAVTADGQLARCQRVEQGAFRKATDTTGTTYYLHRLTEGPRPPVELSPRQNAQPRRAGPDDLHAVYDALLARLVLTQANRDQMRKRGLADPEIDRRLYRSLPIQGRARLARELAERFGAELLLTVPGFVTRSRDGTGYLTIAGAAGLLVPVRNIAGQIIALKARRDDAGDGPRYSYVSSTRDGGPGPGSPVHVPFGVAGGCPVVRLTEGELKSDVATCLSGLPTISTPGCAAWRSCLSVLRELRAATVRIAFDADAAEKAAVGAALAACVEGLAAEGFAVEVERWPAKHKGIDDALAAGAGFEVVTGDAAHRHVAEALVLATAGEPPEPPNPLDRLGDVLRAGGARVLFGDAELLGALARLAETDPASWACYRDRLAGAGVRLRDLDKALAPLRKALRAAAPPPASAGEYRIRDGCMVHVRHTREGDSERLLSTFVARIVEEIVADDGAEQSMHMVIEGQLPDGTRLRRVEVPATEFRRMEWVIPAWGPRAVVDGGRGTWELLRAAIQMLSGDVPKRQKYRHLGWCRFGEQWVYLHAGGAIGAAGPVAEVAVSPPALLASYLLPEPPAGGALRRAVRASLHLLKLAPGRLAYPCLSAVYRAVLGDTDFTLHQSGGTGRFKTQMAALMQQHHGPAMDADHLPCNWLSTGNSLEDTAFSAKDALLVVDDYAPARSIGDRARMEREAERLLRAQGNHAGRQRLRADGTQRPAKPPRGLILSTGEDVPGGQSIRARLLVLDVAKDDISAKVLTGCQAAAAAGLYAQALAGYLRWLAPRYNEIRGRMAADHAELRQRAAGDGQHARTPGIVADLAMGLRYLLDFATECGAIDATERAALWERGWAALGEAGGAQAEEGRAADPAEQFLEQLSAAIASGRAHVAAPDGGYPESPSAWGWRREDAHNGPSWRPQGKRIGWVDGEHLYLEPRSAYAEAQTLASQQGECLAATRHTLWKRLQERGLLAGRDERRQRNTVRRSLEGQRSRDVLHLRADALSSPGDPDETEQEKMRTPFDEVT